MQKKRLTAWISVITSCLFFFYSVFEMVMLNTLGPTMAVYFVLTTDQLATLAAVFFYVSAICLIPAGMIFDFFSKKKIILVFFAISLIGDVLIIVFHQWTIILIARALVALGCSFSLLGCFRLVVDWFSLKEQGRIMGLMLTLGLSGGLVAQTPLAILLLHTSFITVLISISMMGLIFWIAILCFVKEKAALQIKVDSKKILTHLRQASARWTNWGCGIYAGSLNLAITLLGALWGNLYLTHVRHLSLEKASLITTMLFVGMMMGAPLIGWLSDQLQKKHLLMHLFALLSIGALVTIIYLPHFSLIIGMGLFFLLGIFSGVQTLTYSLVADINPVAIVSTATSLISFSLNLIAALMQNIVGLLARHDNYRQGLFVMLLMLILASFIPLSFARKKQKI